MLKLSLHESKNPPTGPTKRPLPSGVFRQPSLDLLLYKSRPVVTIKKITSSIAPNDHLPFPSLTAFMAPAAPPVNIIVGVGVPTILLLLLLLLLGVPNAVVVAFMVTMLKEVALFAAAAAGTARIGERVSRFENMAGTGWDDVGGVVVVERVRVVKRDVWTRREEVVEVGLSVGMGVVGGLVDDVLGVEGVA